MSKQKKVDVLGKLSAMVADRLVNPDKGRKGVASFEEVPGVSVNGNPARVQQILRALVARIAEKAYSKVASADWKEHKDALAEALEEHNIMQVGPMRGTGRDGKPRFFSVLFPADAPEDALPKRGAEVSDDDVKSWDV